MAEGYVARLPSNVIARIAPRGPTPGEAIGAGLARLGGTLGEVASQNAQTEERIAQSNHRIALDIQARERSAVSAMWMGKLADLKLETRKSVADLRASSNDGAIGHEDAVQADIDKRVDGFMQGLEQATGGDPEVIERFAPSIRAVRDDVLGDEMMWALSKRAEAQGRGFEKALDGIRNEQLGKPDADRLVRDLAGLKQMVDAADWDGNTKTKVWDSALQGAFGSTLDGLIAGGQTEKAETILSGKTLDGILSPEQKQLYGQRVQAAVRERQLEIERAASAEREAAMDDLKLIKVLAEDGKEGVPQSRINAALDRAKRAGVKPDVLAEYAYIGEGAVQGGTFRAMPTPALAREVAGLTAKRSAGQISPEEERRLGRAEKVLDARDTEKGDGLGNLWRTGGEQGQAQVMAQLATLPGDERVRVADKMGQGRLALVAGLRPQVQQVALAGGRMRAARPDAFMPVGPKGGEGDQKQVRAAFNRVVSPALANALGGRYDDVLEATLDFYAGSRAQANADGWSEAAFAKAVNVIYGAYRDPSGKTRGGLGEVRGRKVELPPHWTAQEFDQRMSTYDFAAEGAVYRDGRRAERSDVLANYQPVVERVDNGRVIYRLQDARGRALMRKDGRVFELPVNDDPRNR